MSKKRFNNDTILTFGDDHGPFQHEDAIRFLGAIKREVEPDRIIHLGDLMDQYCFSRYPKDPEMLSVNEEIKKARKYVRQLINLFPEMTLVESNHDSRMWDRALAAGIPKGLIVPYLQLIGADHGGWKLKRDLTLTVDSTRDQIYFCHYRTADIMQLAQLVGSHAVQGHTHTRMGVTQVETPTKHLFGMQVGCLISDSKYAFGYNRQQIIRPILGAGLIISVYLRLYV